MNDTAAILQTVRDGDMPVVERLLSADPRLVRAGKTPLCSGIRKDCPRREAGLTTSWPRFWKTTSDYT